MITIKPHTHEDRQRIINEMIPLIKGKLGNNLIALAACCSFARNEDAEYSDLELSAFVKTMPADKTQDGVAKIFDGMLVELVWMTKEEYVKNTIDVNPQWHYSGSDTLLPLLNVDYIKEITAFRTADVERKCLDQAVGCFTELQEAVSKVLNAITQDNHEGMPILFFEMLSQVLRILSFLNQSPYTTASRMIAQARRFSVQPRSLNQLLDLAVKGGYQDFSFLKDITISVFEEIEDIFLELDLPLADDNLDPDQLAHDMRRMQ